MIDLEENKRKLQEIKNRFLSLENSIGKIEELEKQLKLLEDKTLSQDFWNDTKNSNIVLKEIKEVKGKYTSLKNIKQEIANLIEMNEFLLLDNDEELSIELAKNTFTLVKEIEKLEIRMYLSGKYDKNNAIITLHPGAGGTESQDWVQMLYRMYSRWAANNRLYLKRNRISRAVMKQV